MNAPEGENTNRENDPAAPDFTDEEIKKQKPLVRSLTKAEPEDENLESDKPNLPPAMPPLM